MTPLFIEIIDENTNRNYTFMPRNEEQKQQQHQGDEEEEEVRDNADPSGAEKVLVCWISAGNIKKGVALPDPLVDQQPYLLYKFSEYAIDRANAKPMPFYFESVITGPPRSRAFRPDVGEIILGS